MDLDDDELKATKELYKRGYGKKGMIKRLEKIISSELEEIQEKGFDKKDKLEKANVLLNMHQILKNYDELEPVLIKYFAEKHNKDKFKEIELMEE